MTPAEILRAAKAKIKDPVHWCQGSLAQDSRGLDVREDSTDACRWCALGAAYSVSSDLAVQAIRGPLTRAAREMLGRPKRSEDARREPAIINDTTDHATVMAMYNRAIELAEAEAS